MNKEFITYEQALELKELGFDEPCFVYWVFDGVEITFSTSHNKSGWSMIGFKNSQMTKKAGLCTAPTFSQAFRWFREKKYQAEIIWRGDMEVFCWKIGRFRYGSHFFSPNDFETYEEAELACLKKLIEIVKQPKQ